MLSCAGLADRSVVHIAPVENAKSPRCSEPPLPNHTPSRRILLHATMGSTDRNGRHIDLLPSGAVILRLMPASCRQSGGRGVLSNAQTGSPRSARCTPPDDCCQMLGAANVALFGGPSRACCEFPPAVQLCGIAARRASVTSRMSTKRIATCVYLVNPPLTERRAAHLAWARSVQQSTPAAKRSGLVQREHGLRLPFQPPKDATHHDKQRMLDNSAAASVIDCDAHSALSKWLCCALILIFASVQVVKAASHVAAG